MNNTKKWFLCMLAGVLVSGTPVYASAESETEVIDRETAEEIDIVWEAEAAGETEAAALDDATDNLYHYYTIMGDTTVSAEQLEEYYCAQGHEYPGEILQEGGAKDLTDFCQIFMEEAQAEGVRAEVAFVQSMQETGWLQFQGNVKIEQYNFAGLGSTEEGVSGASFPDVRTGIRAQIQHLKAYACSRELVNACEDERFSLVRRGTAPYVEWLGIQENPYGTGWASAKGYGTKLREMLEELKG